MLVADTVTTWLRLGEDRPTLCFAVDRAHARKLADEFEAAGVPTGYVDANTPADERERIGRRLREGQIKVVCNVYHLTTGVDLGRALHHPGQADQVGDPVHADHRPRPAHRGGQGRLPDPRPLATRTLRLGFVTDIHHETLDDGNASGGQGQAREKPVRCRRNAPPAPT